MTRIQQKSLYSSSRTRNISPRPSAKIPVHCPPIVGDSCVWKVGLWLFSMQDDYSVAVTFWGGLKSWAVRQHKDRGDAVGVCCKQRWAS